MMQSRSLISLALPTLVAGCLLGALAHQPAAASSSRQMQGAALFADKGCSHCHGPAGFGGSDTGPDLSHVRKELKKDQIATQIRDGGKNMPPFGDSLSKDEIAALVDYLHSKRKPPPAATHAAATEPATTPKSDPD
jgi:mono/diheme cytochrome c family protein